ncbi:MAG TPA: hypothetical protein VFZ78_01450 [Flavisolibacter sp.]
MKRHHTPIMIALIFAVLLIFSSYIFKGRPVGDWIDAAICLAGIVFLFNYYSRSGSITTKKSPTGC